MEDPSHRFLVNRWLVHNQFMSIGNPLEVVVHYLLIKGMASVGHRNEFPMASTLVYIVIGPTVSHDLRLSSSHDFIKLLHYVVSQPWENIEFVSKLVAWMKMLGYFVEILVKYHISGGVDTKLITNYWLGKKILEKSTKLSKYRWYIGMRLIYHRFLGFGSMCAWKPKIVDFLVIIPCFIQWLDLWSNCGKWIWLDLMIMKCSQRLYQDLMAKFQPNFDPTAKINLQQLFDHPTTSLTKKKNL